MNRFLRISGNAIAAFIAAIRNKILAVCLLTGAIVIICGIFGAISFGALSIGNSTSADCSGDVITSASLNPSTKSNDGKSQSVTLHVEAQACVTAITAASDDGNTLSLLNTSSGVWERQMIIKGTQGPGSYPVSLTPSPGGNGSSVAFNVDESQSKNYYWPWFDSQNMQSWILMSNPPGSGKFLGLNLSIGSDYKALKDSFENGPGVVPEGNTLIYSERGLLTGPVKVGTQTGGSAIVSQRSLMRNSFEEVRGTDSQKLSDNYFWPWYDEKTPGTTDWILVANPSQTDTVHVELTFLNIEDGQKVAAQSDIPPGQNWNPTFVSKMGGPLELKAYLAGGSWPSDKRNVVASQRVLSNYGAAFNEVPGIPAGDLSGDYLWTWYDNKSPGFTDWVLVANPGASTVYYEVRVAGSVMPTSSDNPGAIPAGGKVAPSFPGVINGPVEVITCSQSFDTSGNCPSGATRPNVIASQRSLVGPSFEEVPGYPKSALSSDYLWTWYDNRSVGSTNWVLVANPGDTAVTYQVKIGGQAMPTTADNPGIIPAHGKVTATFPGTMNGPVEVTSSGGNVMASQRVMWNGYFNEVMGSLLN